MVSCRLPLVQLLPFLQPSPGLLSGPPVQPCLRAFAYTIPTNVNCDPALLHLCPHGVLAQLLSFGSQLNLLDFLRLGQGAV